MYGFWCYRWCRARLILLPRPWRLPDQASRELSALAAAMLSGVALSKTVRARLEVPGRIVRRSSRAVGSLPVFDADDAFIALLIAAMDVSGHVSAEEAARAHHIIWSMRRFRHRSGETVGRKIERVRALIERHGSSRIIEATSKKFRSRLRGEAFAIATATQPARSRRAPASQPPPCCVHRRSAVRSPTRSPRR